MRLFLIFICLLALVIPVSAEPVLSESFDYEGAGKLLPKPWENGKDKDGNEKGAILYDQGLTFKGLESKGLAATFKDRTQESYVSTKPKALSGTNTFYIRCLVQPVVNNEGGWGNQPVCIAFANSENNHKDGIWVGITQDVNGEKGEKGRDYFAVATGARPTMGWGNERVFTFTEMGPIQDQAVYLLLAKFEINNKSGERTCKAYLNVYKPGSETPTTEPTEWQFETPEKKLVYPLGNADYTFDQVIIHRDNTSESAIFDEILIGTLWSDIGEKQTPKLTTPKEIKTDNTADTNKKDTSPKIEITIKPINTGHTD